MRTQKMISMPEDVVYDIQERKERFGFKLSEWIVKRYIDEFMSVDKIKEEIKTKQEEIKKLKEKAEIIQLKSNNMLKELSESQKRFLEAVPLLISEGKEWNPLKNRFNNEFNTRWSLDKFKKMVRYFSENAQRT